VARFMDFLSSSDVRAAMRAGGIEVAEA
jgi:hypothetical protein